VETDWYAHETEFRYVLQPGEAISGARNMPVGQVFFVPRETVTMRDCTAEELTAIRESKREFARQKSAVTLPTPHGLQYSPYYARQSKARKPLARYQVSGIRCQGSGISPAAAGRRIAPYVTVAGEISGISAHAARGRLVPKTVAPRLGSGRP
jgi:hypothetical protein